MKYFLDTEFLEGKQKKRFIGIPYGETAPTIDLISIGIVAEEGREYYAVSKDFNLKEAWNRYQMKQVYPDDTKEGVYSVKEYWIRDNVLEPIYDELFSRETTYSKTYFPNLSAPFSYKTLKNLIRWHGKTNKQIAEDIHRFVNPECIIQQRNGLYPNPAELLPHNQSVEHGWAQPEFYAYYADYDWVVFCWLFGKMIDLPKGFPMYCRDLKQMLDEKSYPVLVKQTEGSSQIMKVVSEFKDTYRIEVVDAGDSLQKIGGCYDIRKSDVVAIQSGSIKLNPNYPKQVNEHNALADAKWNKELFSFLTKKP